ncbi:MAG: DUF3568 family protein [Desulfococcaceae bacterium]
MNTGKKIICGCLLSLCCLIMAGCGFFIAGSVAGVGVYSYVNGELIRSYQTGYDQTLEVCTDVLEKQDLRITGTEQKSLSTTISSEYYNGKPVTVKVTRRNTDMTEVAIRSGIMGVWDREFSERIHAAIAKQLEQ